MELLFNPEMAQQLARMTGYKSLTSDEYEAERVRWDNESSGALPGPDCPICRNRGYHTEMRDGYIVSAECECMKRRRSERNIKSSGLSDMVARYTFDAYQTPEPWHQTAKAIAKDYAESPAGWFVAAGNVGTGKTHLCTAICGQLMEAGKEVRYMLWRDDGAKLKSLVTDEAAYNAAIRPYKSAEVLYIDDFWKGAKVTDGDINLAFELLNYRYNDSKKITIISTEKTVEQMMEIDEAIGSRIYERSKGNFLRFANKQNWRLKNGD